MAKRDSNVPLGHRYGFKGWTIRIEIPTKYHSDYCYMLTQKNKFDEQFIMLQFPNAEGRN
jgi:hypothetical protein